MPRPASATARPKANIRRRCLLPQTSLRPQEIPCRSGSPVEIPAVRGRNKRKDARAQRRKGSGSPVEIPAVWAMAIGTLGGAVKFRCDELPPNDASMRFSSRFQGILPMSPPPAGFGPCCLPFVNGRLSLHLHKFRQSGNSTRRRCRLPIKFP
jgi:hypothetical protein